MIQVLRLACLGKAELSWNYPNTWTCNSLLSLPDAYNCVKPISLRYGVKRPCIYFIKISPNAKGPFLHYKFDSCMWIWIFVVLNWRMALRLLRSNANFTNFTTLLKPYNIGTHLKGIETSFQVVSLFLKSFHFWVNYFTFLNFLKIPGFSHATIHSPKYSTVRPLLVRLQK
jgi:hypothetical protein